MVMQSGHALTTPILVEYKEVTLTIEMRETNKVGHVKLFTNEIEALMHEMNKFGFVTSIFVVKSELTQLVPLKANNFWKFMVCLCDPSALMYWNLL